MVFWVEGFGFFGFRGNFHGIRAQDFMQTPIPVSEARSPKLYRPRKSVVVEQLVLHRCCEENLGSVNPHSKPSNCQRLGVDILHSR